MKHESPPPQKKLIISDEWLQKQVKIIEILIYSSCTEFQNSNNISLMLFEQSLW